jgi:hypothetical protein
MGEGALGMRLKILAPSTSRVKLTPRDNILPYKNLLENPNLLSRYCNISANSP